MRVPNFRLASARVSEFVTKRNFNSLLILAVLFGAGVLLQWRAGAWDSEFGRYPDEGMHYVSGLLIHDFALSGQWSAPVKFAKDFYLHFPKIGLGNWPPGFPLLQAAWMFLFGVSRVSLLLLMPSLTATLAFVVYRTAAPFFGAAVSLFVALVLIAAPLSQAQTAMVMTEIPLALFSLLAILALIRFLESGRTSDANWFALWTATSIMIKGSGWVVAVAVAAALLFTRRLDILRKPYFWRAVFVISLLCVPYTLFTMRVVAQGWNTSSFPGPEYLLHSLQEHSAFAISLVGAPLAVLGVAGLADRVFRRKREPFWVVLSIYGAVVIAFHAAVPTSIEPRKIYQIAPVACLFIAAGLEAAYRRIPARLLAPNHSRYALVVLAAALFLAVDFRIIPTYAPGFGPVVKELIARPDTRGAAILVSSNPFMFDSEAALIAEWAERERNAGTYLVRGTKLLNRALRGRSGFDYEPVSANPEEMRSSLVSVPISYVIMHTTPAARSYKHHALLKATLERHPQEWERIYQSRRFVEQPHEIEVYRCRRNLQGVPVKFSIDLTGKIGDVLTPEK